MYNSNNNNHFCVTYKSIIDVKDKDTTAQSKRDIQGRIKAEKLKENDIERGKMHYAMRLCIKKACIVSTSGGKISSFSYIKH